MIAPYNALQRTRREHRVKSAVAALQRFADSFEGLTLTQARAKLKGGKLIRGRWDGGKELIATFPQHEVRVLFSGRQAVMTSIQILAK